MENSNVYQKVQLVMKDVTFVAKDGTVTVGQRAYSYTSEVAMVGALHGSCAEHGLVIFPVGREIIAERQDKTQAGNILHVKTSLDTFRFADADNPESFFDVVVYGEGSDTGDKTMNKCMTAAYKYALRQTFMIATGDDPDAIPSDEATRTAATTTRTTPKPAPTGDTVPCDWPGCESVLKGYTSTAGKTYTTEQVVGYSRNDCDGKALCFVHRKAYKEGGRPVIENEEPSAVPADFLAEAETNAEYYCAGCSKPVTKAVRDSSIAKHNKSLCMTCAKKEAK